LKAFKKGIVVLFCMMLMASMILSGCGTSNSGSEPAQNEPAKGKTETSTTTPAPTKVEEKKVEFKIVTWALPGRKEAMNKLLEDYKKIKPNVTITYEEVAQNNKDFDTWMAAQLAGNQAPEVAIHFTGDVPYGNYVDKGYKILEMDPYLDKESPYTKKKWKESFREVDINTMRSTQDGKLYNIATSMVTLKIAYNKDIYDKLGLKVPKTYPEMIENFKKIREAKAAEPFAGFLKITANWDWFARFVAQQTQEHFVQQIDTIQKNNKYESNEYIKAIDTGIIDVRKPEIKRIYELFRDFSSYFAPGSVAMSIGDATDMWLQGKAAHAFTINFDAKPFASDKKPPFNWDTFEFPVITKDVAPTSNENPAEFGDLGEAFIVMPSAISKNIQDDVVDFIMFYTSPQSAAKMADERWIIPTTVGVEPNPNLKRYLPKNRPQKMIDLNTHSSVSPAARQFVHQQIQRYALNDITTDQLLDLIDKTIKEEAEKVKKDKGWTKENNYGYK
jgi:ABC-type glycerol-3-phosphate transport system substrate-binding protein